MLFLIVRKVSMKEKLKNKKVVYTIIGIISVLLVAIAVTYAYWLVTRSQSGENTISSACLDISLSNEQNDITLTNQFPMSDEDGMELVPYEFTVTNNCNTSVDYQIALEAIGDESESISSNALKVALNDNAKLFSSYAEVDTTVEGAYEARKLVNGTLSSKGSEGSSNSHSLRIWLDADADISEMNKTFASKIAVTIGQGIKNIINPYEDGTLAHNIIDNYGGTAQIETLSSKWREAGQYEEYVNLTKDVEYFWSTDIEFDETNGKYKLAGTVFQATIDECRSGEKTDGTKINCAYYDMASMGADFVWETYYKVTSLYCDNSDYADYDNYTYITTQVGYSTNLFKEGTKKTDVGLYKTEDDLGDSYYFRGNPTNNYVKFGTYAEDTTLTVYDYKQGTKTVEVSAGTPMYWRIVRINGDGSIRLIYDGTAKAENYAQHVRTIGYTVYSRLYNDVKYAGYTYDDGNGNQADSIIKEVIDSWYDKHLELNYGKYIADSIFCNDRQAREEGGTLYYASYDRLYNNSDPALTCTNKEDRYTVNDTTNGNGLLSNPVGLLTADEAFMAGGRNGVGEYYLRPSEPFWTATPDFFTEGNSDNKRIWYVANGGLIGSDELNERNGVRPVINLTSDVKFTGDGSFETPYEIVVD